MAMIVAVVMRMIVIVGMIVVVAAMAMIVTMVVAVMVIIGRRSGNLAPLGAKARQLQSSREEHQGDQPRDIHRFLNEIADLQPEQVDSVAGRRNIPPDQHRHRCQQHNANPAPAPEDASQPLPIDGTQPEGHPAHQGQPGPQQRQDRPHHIENRLEQRTKRLKQLDDRVHVRAA